MLSDRPVVYFDANASTPVDPRVLEAMLPFFTGAFGNSASQHRHGWTAAAAVQAARVHVADLIKAQSAREIHFTSGATESIDLVFKNIWEAKKQGGHIISTGIEHDATERSLKFLEGRGFSVTRLKVNGEGKINLAEVEAAIRTETILLSIIHANNEFGTVQKIHEIGRICKSNSVLLHVDAAQSFGKIPIDVQRDHIDFLSVSGHKIYAPKGIGALYVRSGVAAIERFGTPNVPGIVGLGEASRLAAKEMATDALRCNEFRSFLIYRLRAVHKETRPGTRGRVVVNGAVEDYLPNNLSLTFLGVPQDQLLTVLNRVSVSQSSACSASHLDGSRVLQALGLNKMEARQTIRIGLSRFTTQSEVEILCAALESVLNLC